MKVLRRGTGMQRVIMPALSLILLQTVSVREAALISLLTEEQVFVLNHGQTLDISCEFVTEQFDMFDNPVVWKKFQRQEETQINIMGNIIEPLLATNRFEVTFDDAKPRYCLRLRIRNLTAEDSGNYTCEIRGRKSVVLAHVTHFIFVRASVKMLFLTSDNTSSSSSSSSPDGMPSLDSRLSRIVFVENRPKALRCFSTGGYPVPDIVIRINDRDVSDQFVLSSSSSFYGKPGLRLMVTQTERATAGLRLTADDDDARLRCIVTVPGLMPNVTEAVIEVNYGPIIVCSPAFAFIGQRNAMLRCEVRAKPEVLSLFWIIDVNGTTLSKGEVTDEHWSLVMVRDDGVMETQLHIRQVLARNFRSYSVVAENPIAINVQLVQLQSIKPTATPTRTTSHLFQPSTGGTWRRQPSVRHPGERHGDNHKYSLISHSTTSVAAAAFVTTSLSSFLHVIVTTIVALSINLILLSSVQI